MLIYLDYRYHSFLAKRFFANYEWLGYFRYNMKLDLVYSIDVIVATTLFIIILLVSFVRKKFSNFMFITFPVICVIIHLLTLN